TMEKGNLTKWLKKEGDKVKPGDVIAEIETDKATMEYEAIDEGTLAKIVVPEGTQDVPVKALIAVLAEEGEDVKAAAAGAGKGRPPLARAGARRRRGRRRRRRTRQAPQCRRHRWERAFQHVSRQRRVPRRRPRRLPFPRVEKGQTRGFGPRTRTASSRLRWRVGWRKRPASTSHALGAPARTAA